MLAAIRTTIRDSTARRRFPRSTATPRFATLAPHWRGIASSSLSRDRTLACAGRHHLDIASGADRAASRSRTPLLVAPLFDARLSKNTAAMPPARTSSRAAATAARAAVAKSAAQESSDGEDAKPVKPAAAAATSRRRQRKDSTSADEEEGAKIKDESAAGEDDAQQQQKPKRRKVAAASPSTAAAAAKPAARKKGAGGASLESAAAARPRTDVATLPKAMYIGAHVSASGGVQNAVPNALHIGANAFALFLKSQRKWASPPLADDARDGYRAGCAAHGYASMDHVLPHGSYLVNLAQPDAAKAAVAYGCFVDDLRRCAALGIRLFNFHPGSAGGCVSRADAIQRIAAQLNRAHKDTAPPPADDAGSGGGDRGVVTVLENMAGQGSVVGGPWEDLRDIIALVDDKDRVGVCIDTCHAFAYGHDLRTKEALEATMGRFDEIVGLKYLKALHLNDSKAPLGSHKDLHANIGTGYLGLRAFHAVMNFAPFASKPLILETPPKRPVGSGGKGVEDPGVWADEIKLLESLVGMDPDSAEFLAREKELAALGKAERDRVGAVCDKAAAKGKKKKTAGKGKKPDDEDTECESCTE